MLLECEQFMYLHPYSFSFLSMLQGLEALMFAQFSSLDLNQILGILWAGNADENLTWPSDSYHNWLFKSSWSGLKLWLNFVSLIVEQSISDYLMGLDQVFAQHHWLIAWKQSFYIEISELFQFSYVSQCFFLYLFVCPFWLAGFSSLSYTILT